MNKKSIVIGVAIIVALVLALVLCLVLFFGDTASPDPTPSTGILNEKPLWALDDNQVEHREDREQAEQAKPTRSPEDQEDLEETVLGYLSRLDYSGLSRYLMRDAAQFQANAYVEALKVDLANTMGATETTAPMLLLCYRTPEVLAAAVASMPMEHKLESFLSADSLIIPAQTGDIGLHLSSVTQEELDALLERANANTTSLDRCSEAVAYDMTLNGLPCRLWMVKTPNGWRPYLLEQQYNYSAGGLTQLEARKIKESIYSSGATLDSVVNMGYFDEEAYLADMEAHPELYNEDRSRKAVADQPRADAVLPES